MPLENDRTVINKNKIDNEIIIKEESELFSRITLIG